SYIPIVAVDRSDDRRCDQDKDKSKEKSKEKNMERDKGKGMNSFSSNIEAERNHRMQKMCEFYSTCLTSTESLWLQILITTLKDVFVSLKTPEELRVKSILESAKKMHLRRVESPHDSGALSVPHGHVDATSRASGENNFGTAQVPIVS